MIALAITVDTADDSWTVRPTVGTFVRFERQFDVAIGELASGIALQHVAWLAWEASRHQGRNVPATFDAFIDQVTNLAVEADDSPLAAGQ